jgi:hypothetical protein
MENFGKKATDKVTGFTGIITAKALYMYGCSQYLLNPKVDKEGKLQEGEWFDEGRIKIIKDEINPESVKVKENGCEYRDHPKKH